MSIFKACDIRGVVGSDLNEEIARKIGRALGTMVGRSGGGPVYLAGDFRRSTPASEAGVAGRLARVGRKRERRRTSAHAGRLLRRRPAGMRQRGDRHGITQCRPVQRREVHGGRPAGDTQVDGQLQTLLEIPVTAQQMKPVEPVDVLGDYEASVPARAAELSGGDPRALARRRLTIVLDAMGGAYSDIARVAIPRTPTRRSRRPLRLRCARPTRNSLRPRKRPFARWGFLDAGFLLRSRIRPALPRSH